MKIEFRPAYPEDLHAIVNLVGNAIKVMENQDIYQWDEQYPNQQVLMQDIEKKQLHVGVIEEKIVVIFVLNQECDDAYSNGEWKYVGASYFVIHRLCVNPDFQNHGIAKYTMLYIEDFLISKGIETIRLDAYTKNLTQLSCMKVLDMKKWALLIGEKDGSF